MNEKTCSLLLTELGIGREKNERKLRELNLQVKEIPHSTHKRRDNVIFIPINRIKYKFQFDEDDETWDDVCEEFGIQIDDNTTEISSSESSIETNGDTSEDISEETREDCKVSEHEKETRGRAKKRLHTRARISSSSSDSSVKVEKKKKQILIIDSDSSTDGGGKSGMDEKKIHETSTVDEMGHDRKPVRILVDGVTLFKCPDCDETSRSDGKTYSHMAKKHGMKKFECNFCHFSTSNKTSMQNHKRMYCRELKKNIPHMNEGTSEKPKAVKKVIDGCSYFGCPLCDFIAKSGGKVDGHLVTEHGYNKLICDYCKFSTPNSTSMHNHKRLYCRSLKK